MTPDHIRHLLGGYATGTLTDQEKKLLFEAALDDQELFDAVAADESLRSLLEDSESRGYLLEALEEGMATGDSPVVITPVAQGGKLRAMPSPPPPVHRNWMQYGAIAASAVVLFGASVYAIRQFGGRTAVEIASAPKNTSVGEVPAPARPLGSQPSEPRPILKRDGAEAKSAAVSAPPVLADKQVQPADDRSSKEALNKDAAPQKVAEPERDKGRLDEVARTNAPGFERKAAEEALRAPAESEARKREAPAQQQPAPTSDSVGLASQAPAPRLVYNQNTQTPDGSRLADASEIYQRQQAVNQTNFRAAEGQTESSRFGNLGKLSSADDSAGKAKRREQSKPAAAAAPAPAPSPAMAGTATASGGARQAAAESPGVRYQVRRKDAQGKWVAVAATTPFKTGDEIALHVEQNVAGEVRVFYQDQSLRPVALALFDDAGGKRTAPFKLEATGTALFTIVLRGPSAGADIPAPPASQVAEAEGPTNYVVRPNAPANAPVVARISLTVR